MKPSVEDGRNGGVFIQLHDECMNQRGDHSKISDKAVSRESVSVLSA